MLKQRVLSALIFVPVSLCLVYLGGAAFNLFWIGVLVFAGIEFVRMVRKAGFQLSYPLLIGMIVVLSLLRWRYGLSFDSAVLPGFFLVCGAYAIWQFEQGDEKALQNLALHIFGAIYIGVLGSYGISLNEGWLQGNWWLLVIIALIWLADAGAYLVGTRFGKTVILPRLSPKKTLEGFFGGLLTGIVAGFLLGWLLLDKLPEMGMWKVAMLGSIMGLLAFFGDALMSLIKRTAGIKDTGKLLPGHGGILDRLDSMLWALAVGYYFSKFIVL